MAKVLILGANGKIARLAEHIFVDTTDTDLRLYLRNAGRLKDFADSHTLVETVEGDATNVPTLIEAMKDVDMVYANLAGGNIEDEAKAVVEAMHAEKKTRLVWISTLGIYDEVPGKFGEWNNKTLGNYITTYAAAAKVIEDSDLDYTIIRPAWLTDKPEVDYEVTQKGEAFKGTEVSRRSIAQVVVDISQDPDKYKRESIGVNKPNTDGDKPAWY
ncbi:SDR family oxidoreductase [Companilactobacillus nantensis]|uniref:Saccharopine dehydrogenase related protein n=1 Tax=Companilactobacillus nantensis DSM 16982 TaxID=1423774 RepID=A0A0R1WM52_9LACO|nr:SDR family oxidoreductase [Companilactobacillus nantensis]KRM16843.1 saccharopine dehydrogenase related protein [Companilactobacillus nantensis DSM 16982]GEO64285.1 NAD-dependent dehydratase [Companilactobacillus nantensis]